MVGSKLDSPHRFRLQSSTCRRMVTPCLTDLQQYQWPPTIPVTGGTYKLKMHLIRQWPQEKKIILSNSTIRTSERAVLFKPPPPRAFQIDENDRGKKEMRASCSASWAPRRAWAGQCQGHTWLTVHDSYSLYMTLIRPKTFTIFLPSCTVLPIITISSVILYALSPLSLPITISYAPLIIYFSTQTDTIFRYSFLHLTFTHSWWLQTSSDQLTLSLVYSTFSQTPYFQ